MFPTASLCLLCVALLLLYLPHKGRGQFPPVLIKIRAVQDLLGRMEQGLLFAVSKASEAAGTFSGVIQFHKHHDR